MPAIITDRFRIHNSEQFSEAFSEASGNTFYLGIGRPQPFTTSTRADGRTNNEGTDAAPITPADNVNAQAYPYGHGRGRRQAVNYLGTKLKNEKIKGQY